MTESASALCTRNALSSAMAPGSSAASSTCSVAGVSFGSLAGTSAVESHDRADRPAPTSERKPKRRHRRQARRPCRRAVRSAEKSAAANAVPGADHAGPHGPCRTPLAPATGRSSPRPRTRPASSTARTTQSATGQPVGHEGDDLLTHPLGIEAGVDRPNHLDEEVRPRQAAPQGRLNRPEPLGQIRTDLRHPLSARRTTGARLPTSPRQSTLRPIWNGGSF